MKIFTMVFCLFIACTAHAAVELSTMPCAGGGVVIINDNVISVIECAGQPVMKTQKTLNTKSGSSRVESQVEEWTYVVNGWVYSILIIDGAVASILDMGEK